MASQEGYESPVEQVVEGPTIRGLTTQRSPSKRPKTKALATKDTTDTHLANLEELFEDVQSTVGRLSDDYEGLVRENVEISAAAKEIIKEIGRSFCRDLNALSKDVANLKKFVEGEIYELHKEVERIYFEYNTLRATTNGQVLTMAHSLRRNKGKLLTA
ncbi:uncharacterized protein E6C27_scaffold138G00500 [Cucumis melo var. makuwa]|uniref:Uncharacterized protein n=1 Tax=Cucumis melo var. makuwa TaxID=1194695 RepID=A0A5A7VIG6_CUCMM|nr:uncharacterized protein E6C27_scaffold138G00500 [Cucumis melo var. makuwa]